MKLAEEARLLRLRSQVGESAAADITEKIRVAASRGGTCTTVESKGRGDTWALAVHKWLEAEGFDSQPVPGSHIAVYWE